MPKEIEENKEIFWLDNFKGDAKGGYYCRNNLFQFFEKCKKAGLKVVGIVKPKDWNVEFILAKENEIHKIKITSEIKR